MRNKLIVLLSSLLLLSCGKDKKNEEKTDSQPVVEAAKDNYTIIFDAIYEKDDELTFVYMKNSFWDYDHPQKFKVTGHPQLQKISVSVEQGFKMDNVQFDLSSNSEQRTLTLNNISIFNNGKLVIDGSNRTFTNYFDAGTGLTWDAANLRYNLIFGGEYPPRMQGNKELESILVTK